MHTKRLAAAMVVALGVPALARAQAGAPVEGMTATAGFAGVLVIWEGTELDPGHQAEGAALGGFTLLGALTAGGPVIAALSRPWPPPTPQAPGFIVPSPPPGTYWVVVVKGLTQSTALVPVSAWQRIVVPGPCTMAPPAPDNLRASQDLSNNVSVQWDQPSSGCPATSYEMHAGYAPGLSNAGILVFPGQGYYGPAPPNTYYLRVRARNAYGVSGFSNEIRFVVNPTNCIGPGAPQALQATVAGHLVTLSWLPPGAPGSRPIAQFGVVAGFAPGLSNAGTALLPGTQTSMQATVPPGTYYVRVVATNGCGGTFAWGPPSNELTVVVR